MRKETREGRLIMEKCNKEGCNGNMRFRRILHGGRTQCQCDECGNMIETLLYSGKTKIIYAMEGGQLKEFTSFHENSRGDRHVKHPFS